MCRRMYSWFAIGSLLSVGVGAGGSGADSLPTYEEIARVWQTRERAVSNFDIKWEVGEFRSAGLLAFGRPRPNGNTTLLENKFIVDSEGRARHDQDGIDFILKNDSTPMKIYRSWIDGVETSFIQASFGSRATIQLTSTKISQHLDLMPLVMAVRFADAKHEFFDPTLPIIIEKLPVAHGAQQLRLEQNCGKGKNSSRRILTVDVERDFLPIRYETRQHDRRRTSIEIEDVDEFSPGVWIPMSWKSVKMYGEDESPLWVCTARVTDYRVNEQLSPKTFEIDLPPGTRVNDEVKNRKYIR